jgi:plastocyanin
MRTITINRLRQQGRTVATLAVATALLVLGGTTGEARGAASTGESLADAAAVQAPTLPNVRTDLSLGGWWAQSATSGLLRTTITIGERAFMSAETVVPMGTMISWRNLGREQHTATSPGVWDSGLLRAQQSWSAVFAVPGTFDYVCLIHPAEMSGRIVVTEASGPVSSPAALAVSQPAARAPAPLPLIPTPVPVADGSPPLGAATGLSPSRPTVPPSASQPTPTATGASPPGLAPPAVLAADSRCPPGSRCSPTEITGPPNSLLANVDTGSGQPAAAVASLSPLAGSGVSGEAALLRSGDDTIVTISLRGMAPTTPYTGHVRAAGCTGTILFSLGTVVADHAGEGHSSATVSAPIDPSGWWIDYQTDARAPDASVACGPVNAAR